MKNLGFLALIAFGLTAVSLSFGSTPPPAEITTPRQGRLNFDQDLKNLNALEHRFKERLPRLSERPELASPMKRISAQKYRPRQKAGRAAPVRKVKTTRQAPKVAAPDEGSSTRWRH